ncbi:MAG: LssY C-terminal domain-containing protein [Candidatus Sericytochromatia bacterium]|nr:LssY C-terminal domain-containing protein [Candidatus Sericytochromatia bacterium]
MSGGMGRLGRLAAAWLTVGVVLGTLPGCGRVASPAAVGGATPRQAVGLPASYRVGEPFAGMLGTPAVRVVDWPRITRTKAGVLADPVNLALCGSERHVRHVFGAAGWLPADPVTLGTALKTARTAVLGGSYPTSPMSDLYLYNRRQDLAFQKNAQGTRARDHLRVWRTPLLDQLGRPVWVIAATEDVAIKWGPGALPTHQISPFVDRERELVARDLLSTGHVARHYALQSLPADHQGHNGGGDGYVTDGRVFVLELVPMKDASAR